MVVNCNFSHHVVDEGETNDKYSTHGMLVGSICQTNLEQVFDHAFSKDHLYWILVAIRPKAFQ